MDTSISPEYPADLPLKHMAKPARSWACPWHVSAPATALFFAAVIAGMHFVVRPAAARYASFSAPVVSCRP